MFPPGTRGRARGLPYTMDAFMLGMGMLGESGPGPGNLVTLQLGTLLHLSKRQLPHLSIRVIIPLARQLRPPN